MRLRSAGVLLLFSLIAAGADAASFIVPTDRELVHAAKAIVVAKNVSSYVVPGDGDKVYTVYDMEVEEVIKGAITSPHFELVEIGGFIGNRGVAVAGTPTYRAGERALLFLDDRNRGEWRTWSMGIGKFSFVRDLHGVRLLMRGQDDDAIFGWDSAGNPFHDVIRSEEKFLDFVRQEACGGIGDASYVVDESKVVLQRKVKPAVNGAGFHACDYAFNIGPFCGGCGACGGKFQSIFDQPGGGGSVAYQLVGTQAGVNGPTGVNNGMAAWNGDSLSNVNLGVGSSSSNTIHFDDTADTTANCGSSAVGCTETNYSGSLFTFDTGSFIPIVGNLISFKAGFTANQTAFDQVACHELGHSIGFRHSDQGTPSTTQSVMVATAGPSFFGAVLQGWDTDAIKTMYNPNPDGACSPVGVPTVSANPSTISPGGSSQLTASASGTSPTFTWFTGNPGDTTTQVGTGAQINVSPSVTTKYWARATNSCSTGPVNSATSVTVTVQCNPPTTATATANPTSVVSGGTSTISVSADGTGPLTYQLFQGGNPVGGTTTNPNIVTPALTTTSTFLVQVTNACSTGPIRSNTVTVTVTACTAPTTATASANPASITTGGATQLSVIANGTGPLSVQWFIGTPPGGTFITGGNAATITQFPTTTTTYYAQVSNSCGATNSNTVTVTVAAQCTPPSNAVAAATPTSIQSGQTASLSVTANGTGLGIQWFTGTPPNGVAIPGATAAAVPVAPTATTTYFARVTGQCGTPSQIDSNAVTVTVTAACIDPTITTQPASQTIAAGGKATLTVAATGTAPLHYQWFEGATGDTSKPRGTDSATFTTAALSKATQFWVQVRGCNADKRANSNTATIDVKIGRRRAVEH